MYTILLCDDEEDIVSALEIYLSADPNYRILKAGNGQEALNLLGKNEVHLVLMDIMMPVMDGITAMARMRKLYNIPIILLTAKGEETDKILGLNVGADDYVTKPFSPLELMARVKSHLRRYTQLGSAVSESGDDVLVNGSIEMNDTRKQVFVDGEEIKLTPTEYDILKLLLSHPGQVFSPNEIYNQIWKEDPLCANNTVAVHIRRIREKIEINPNQPQCLKVVWGRGYKMERSS